MFGHIDYRARRLAFVSGLVASFSGSAAWGAVTLAGTVNGTSPSPKSPCPRHGDDTRCVSSLNPNPVELISAPSQWFRDTLRGQYPDAAWRFYFVGGNDNLKGKFNVDLYRSFNDCPAAAAPDLGAEIKVTFQPDADSLIKDVLWIQTYREQIPGRTASEVDDRNHLPAAQQPGALFGPFYPFQDEDEDEPYWQTNYQYDYFYDRPGDPCPPPIDGGSVRFETYACWWDDVFSSTGAIIDRDGDNFHDVFIHEGFGWGYDFGCAPEPALATPILALGALFARRRD